MKTLGTWWNDKEIEIVEIEGRPIALSGWNGEMYTDCWEVVEMKGNEGFDIKVDNLEIKPVYEEVDEDDWEIVGYEFY